MDDASVFPDETIWAFIDGETNAKTTLAVLARERRDTAFAERIRAMREETAAIAEAFDAELRPSPSHLVRAVRAAPDAPTGAGDPVRSLAALAAAITLAIGLGALFAEWRFENRLAALEEKELTQRQLVSQLLQQTLEQRLSGEEEVASIDVSGFSARITPTETYKSRTGHWCRTFEETLIADGETVIRKGVACRVDGGWQRLETTTKGETATNRL
ncbi:MAG: hypothetical protein AAF367_13270 [Pseudomonadota bacterium]